MYILANINSINNGDSMAPKSQDIVLERVPCDEFHSYILEVIKQGEIYRANIDLKEDYSDCECWLSTDRTCGYAVTSDKELINVFSISTGIGSAMMQHVRENYAYLKLNCFDGYLRRFYNAAGFVELERVANFDKNGPDVVFMAYGEPEVAVSYADETRLTSQDFIAISREFVLVYGGDILDDQNAWYSGKMEVKEASFHVGFVQDFETIENPFDIEALVRKFSCMPEIESVTAFAAASSSVITGFSYAPIIGTYNGIDLKVPDITKYQCDNFIGFDEDISVSPNKISISFSDAVLDGLKASSLATSIEKPIDYHFPEFRRYLAYSADSEHETPTPE